MTLDQLVEKLHEAQEHGFGNALVGINVANGDLKCAVVEVKATRTLHEWPAVQIVVVVER